MFGIWEVNEWIAVDFWSAASRICSKEHAASLSSSHLTFSQSVSLKSQQCSCTIVLIQLELRRIPILFYLWDLISIRLVAAHAFPICMLTLVQVDKILLQQRYANGSTNFRRLPFNVEMVSFCLKHINSVLFSLLLLQARQPRFDLSWCIYEKC